MPPLVNLMVKYLSDFMSVYEEDDMHLAWAEWIAHMKAYFAATGTTVDATMVAITELQGGVVFGKKYRPVPNETFVQMVARMTLIYKPVNGKAFSKFKLANTKQQARESIDAYIERLEKIIAGCAITDADQIKDLLVSTITINCSSKNVQRFFLSRDNPTVDEIVKEAKFHESIEREQKQILEIKINQVLTDSDIRVVQASGDKCTDCGQLSHTTGSACLAIGKKVPSVSRAWTLCSHVHKWWA